MGYHRNVKFYYLLGKTFKEIIIDMAKVTGKRSMEIYNKKSML